MSALSAFKKFEISVLHNFRFSAIGSDLIWRKNFYFIIYPCMGYVYFRLKSIFLFLFLNFYMGVWEGVLVLAAGHL